MIMTLGGLPGKLLTVLFVGIIALVMIEKALEILTKVKRISCEGNLQIIKTQFQAYYFDKGRYPEDLFEFRASLADRQYFVTRPVCPMSNTDYNYNPKTGGVTCYSHQCEGNLQIIKIQLQAYYSENKHYRADQSKFDTFLANTQCFATRLVCPENNTPYIYDPDTGGVSCLNQPHN